MAHKGKSKGITKARRERMAKALELREAGASYYKIGEVLGVSHTQAANDVDAALKDITRDGAERVRAITEERLNSLYLIAYSTAKRSGDTDKAARIIDRQMRLYGLDAGTSEDGVKAVKTLLDQLLEDPDTTEDATP